MSLSPALQELQAREQAYLPSSQVKDAVKGKVLTALIAPTAVGKSTLIKRVMELGGEDFSESYSIVTRARRPSDPLQYMTLNEGYTIERVTSMIQARELTHYTIHLGRNIYGSLPESFPGSYNLMPCVPSILNVVRRAGFANIYATYIVSTADDWAERLPERQKDPSYSARLSEAIDSLTWGIEHAPEVVFVENASGKLDEAARTILDITQGKQTTLDADYGLRLARDMLVLAQRELALTAT